MNVKACGGPLQYYAPPLPSCDEESDCEYDRDWILSGSKRPIECHVYLLAEEDGEFSILAARLPGLASQGRTENDAIANFAEAFCGVSAAYADRGESIPWLEQPEERPANAKELWIVVDA